jgi:hypothetical protein
MIVESVCMELTVHCKQYRIILSILRLHSRILLHILISILPFVLASFNNFKALLILTKICREILTGSAMCYKYNYLLCNSFLLECYLNTAFTKDK